MFSLEGGGEGGVSSCFPKEVAGRGWDTRVPQVKTAEGRFRLGFKQAEQRFACGGIGTLAVVF